jgi:hypothetical protein
MSIDHIAGGPVMTIRSRLHSFRVHLRAWIHGRPNEFIDENGDDLSAW